MRIAQLSNTKLIPKSGRPLAELKPQHPLVLWHHTRNLDIKPTEFTPNSRIRSGGSAVPATPVASKTRPDARTARRRA